MLTSVCAFVMIVVGCVIPTQGHIPRYLSTNPGSAILNPLSADAFPAKVQSVGWKKLSWPTRALSLLSEWKNRKTDYDTSRESADTSTPLIYELETMQQLDALLASPMPLLLEIYANDCRACQALTPVLEASVKQFKGAVRLCKIDGSRFPNLLKNLGIRAYPTVLSFKNQNIVDILVGVPQADQLRAFYYNLLGAPRPLPGVASLGMQHVDWQVCEKYTPMPSTPAAAAEASAHALTLYKYNEHIHTLLKQMLFSYVRKERLENAVFASLESVAAKHTNEIAINMASTLRLYLSNLLNALGRQRKHFYLPEKGYFANVITKYATLSPKNKVARQYITSYPEGLNLLEYVGFVEVPLSTFTVAHSQKAIGGKGTPEDPHKVWVWRGKQTDTLQLAVEALTKWIEQHENETDFPEIDTQGAPKDTPPGQ